MPLLLHKPLVLLLLYKPLVLLLLHKPLVLPLVYKPLVEVLSLDCLLAVCTDWHWWSGLLPLPVSSVSDKTPCNAAPVTPCMTHLGIRNGKAAETLAVRRRPLLSFAWDFGVLYFSYLAAG